MDDMCHLSYYMLSLFLLVTFYFYYSALSRKENYSKERYRCGTSETDMLLDILFSKH